MSDWDKPDNHTNTIGYLTLYQSNYDDGLSDFVYKFDWEDMKNVTHDLNAYIESMLESHSGEDITDECDLIGINSNSFQEHQKAYNRKHHTFLEWDSEHHIPEMSVLEQMDGMIIETGGGIHFIKENKLLSGDLITQMREWKCCDGFIEYSRRKGHATLRVSPKENNNRLKIIKNKEGFIYSVYRELIESLNDSI